MTRSCKHYADTASLEVWRQCQHRRHLSREIHLYADRSRRDRRATPWRIWTRPLPAGAAGRRHRRRAQLGLRVQPGTGRHLPCLQRRRRGDCREFQPHLLPQRAQQRPAGHRLPRRGQAIEAGDAVSIDLDRYVIVSDAGEFTFPRLSPSVMGIVQAGGLVNYVAEKLAQP